MLELARIDIPAYFALPAGVAGVTWVLMAQRQRTNAEDKLAPYLPAQFNRSQWLRASNQQPGATAYRNILTRDQVVMAQWYKVGDDRTGSYRNASSAGILPSNTYTKHTLEHGLKPESMELIRCRHLNIQTPHVKAIEFVSFREGENRLATKKVIGQELFHTLWNPTNLLGRLQGHRLKNPDTLAYRIMEIGTWIRDGSNAKLPA